MKKNKTQGENPWTIVVLVAILFAHGLQDLYILYEGEPSLVFSILKYILLFVLSIKILLWVNKVGAKEKEEKE
ncbi:hypothetical protein KBG23_01055 [Candidatus Dojkabacteria bacterium]|jgi:uncharacterized membrane protein YciS (DUF1049 family)|nr:hypothetical protein [Candidatus Dojkabacteria bacterium]